MLVSAVQQCELVITNILLLELPSHPPPHPTPPHLDHHRATSGVPCAIQQLPTSYVLHTES